MIAPPMRVAIWAKGINGLAVFPARLTDQAFAIVRARFRAFQGILSGIKAGRSALRAAGISASLSRWKVTMCTTMSPSPRSTWFDYIYKHLPVARA